MAGEVGVFAVWPGWLSQHVTLLLFVNLSLGLLGVPALSEALLVGAGVTISRGGAVPWHVLAAAIVGTIVGMTTWFEVGRTSRGAIADRVARRLRIHGQLARAEAWSQRFGPSSILVAFFAPGLRHVTAVVVGATRLEFTRFIPFVVAGACAWSSLLVAGGYIVGREQMHHSARHEVRRLRGDAPVEGALWRV